MARARRHRSDRAAGLLGRRGLRRRGALRRRRVALAAAAVILAACAAAPAASPPRPSRSGTVWLCRPGLAHDPCTASLRTTVVGPAGQRSLEDPRAAASSRFDCFYVYPTVSSEQSPNADLRVQSAEVAVAIDQASRFSQVCRVWAPMYRQQTLAALLNGSLGGFATTLAVAYRSLLGGWRDYLAHDNHGRPIVFIGHSQGAAMLIRLLASQVDPDPALRSRLVGAILLGGNVTVASGRTVGGSFRSIPACTRPDQFGCVIAYSSFPAQPPADSLFGRPGQGVSLESGQYARSGVEVLCVNPAAIGGGTAGLEPYFLTAALAGALAPPPIASPWVELPGLYSASCRRSAGASWLAISAASSRSDRRPRASGDGPVWGYHRIDVNLALGNLVSDVAREEAAFVRSRG